MSKRRTASTVFTGVAVAGMTGFAAPASTWTPEIHLNNA